MKPKLTEDQVLEAEKAADDRKVSRAKGFELMKTRDSGHGLLKDHNGKASEVWMLWGHDGKFKLDVRLYGGQSVELVFDIEEFRKWLRWA